MTFRGVTLAALMLSASQTAFAEDQDSYVGDGYVTPVAFVGDISTEAEDAYFAADAAEARRLQQRRTRRNATADAASYQNQHVRPAYPLYEDPAEVAQVGCQGGCSGSGCGASNCDAPSYGVPTPAYTYAPTQSYMPEPVYNPAPVYNSGGCASGGCASGGCASGGCASGGCDSGGCASGGCGSIGCGTIFGGGCGSPSCGSELLSGCSSMPSFVGGGRCGSSCGCETGGGCDSMGGCGQRGCKLNGGLASTLGLCGRDGWFRSEVLLWFLQDRNAPPLVGTSAAGVLPRLPDANTVFGNDLAGGFSVGYRGDAGIYLTDNFGIGGRYWVLDTNDESVNLSGNGSDLSIGRPFFNTALNLEDSLLVASTASGSTFAGSVSGRSALDMYAAEAYARLKLGGSQSAQIELIGGYSHFSVEDKLHISSTSVQNTGRIRSYHDQFDTKNKFHGGQIGFESVVSNGRWFARSLTKVHLGNMNERVRIQGYSTDRTAPFAGITTDRGLLAQDNQGTYEDDKFTFIPELNFKIGYRFRQHVEMSVGYSFLMFDSLALAGDQIDRGINPALLNTSINPSGPVASRPAFTMEDTSMWVQGVDLGLAITF